MMPLVVVLVVLVVYSFANNVITIKKLEEKRKSEARTNTHIQVQVNRDRGHSPFDYYSYPEYLVKFSLMRLKFVDVLLVTITE